MTKWTVILVISVVTMWSNGAWSGEPSMLLNRSDRPYRLTLGAELGFTGIFKHNVQFDSQGTNFDYVEDGNQNIAFPFVRLTTDLTLFDRHTVILLYQPFTVETDVLLEEDLVVDKETFAAGTPMNLLYGFDFWRVSYLYDVLAASKHELSFGLSIQWRNATIRFRSKDGDKLRVNQGPGPVPILKARYRYAFDNGLWLGSEIDGFYASSAYINGGDNDFEGAILDASLRVGLSFSDAFDGFLNLRYLGGGGSGTSDDKPGPGDGYTKNWLHTGTLSLGLLLK